MAVIINTNQLKRVLEITPANQNIMLTGKHGIGKSQILKQFFEEHGQKVVILFLGQMSAPRDLTGAGLGMKGENTRNFEAGILSTNFDFVKSASEQFDNVWMGAHCKGCKRKEFCADPIG